MTRTRQRRNRPPEPPYIGGNMKKKKVKITAHMTPRDKEALFEEVIAGMEPETVQKFLTWYSKPRTQRKHGTLCAYTLHRLREVAARA